jgi:signal transduction protein with GAF and PtsI domain
VPEVLSTLCRGLDWDAAELWTMEGEHLRPGETWHARGVPAGLAGADVSVEVGEGAPGRAWALRRPVWLGDLAAEPGCPRAAAGVEAGARSALLLPVVSGRRVRAVVVLLSRRTREPEPAAARALDAIATRIALFFERADAERLIARQALDLAELRAQQLTARP